MHGGAHASLSLPLRVRVACALPSFAATASRRAQLQRMLGDRGEVLPRISRGTAEHPAAGWYATIDGEEVYLGDHAGIAFATIANRLNGKDQ
jgi:hypothetical protein